MPRKNSMDWSDGDSSTAARMNDINEDLDDVFANWSDRLRVYEAVSWTPLRIDIGAWPYYVWSTVWMYAWGTDIAVTNAATNYVMIDNTGTIQISTSAWNNSYARLAIVVCSGGEITSITLWNTGFWGNLSADITWTTVTVDTSWANGVGYLVNHASLRRVITLPTTAAVWQKIAVKWIGAGWWRIWQNASQYISLANKVTTTWTGGYLQSNNAADYVMLECITANTQWEVVSFSWSPTIDDGTMILEGVFARYRATDAEFFAMTEVIKYVTPDHIDNFIIYGAGTNLFASADTERTMTWTTYTKLKEITILKTWTYTIEFDLRNWGAGTGFGRIYKTWVAFWTEQSQATDTHTTKTENLAFTAWDLLQLYVKSSWPWWTPYVRNLRVKWAQTFNPAWVPGAYIWTVVTD